MRNHALMLAGPLTLGGCATGNDRAQQLWTPKG